MVVLYWVNKERSSFRFDRWLCQPFEIPLELGCSLCCFLHAANWVADMLAKWGAEQSVSFIADFQAP